LKIALVQELQAVDPAALDEFERVLNQELQVFKDGEQYDYLKDLKDAFSETLSKPKNLQIFETIPDNFFWDIKTPLVKREYGNPNPYNPFRKYPFESFFDFRDFDEYNERRKLQHNLRSGVSLYRRY